MGSKEDMHAIIQALLSTKHSQISDNNDSDDSTYFSDSIFSENLDLDHIDDEFDEMTHNDSLLGRNTIGFHKNDIININKQIESGVIRHSRSYDSFFKIKDLISIKPKINKLNNKNNEIKKLKKNQEKIIDMIENINKVLLHLHERIDSIDVCINKSFYST